MQIKNETRKNTCKLLLKRQIINGNHAAANGFAKGELWVGH